MSDIQHDRTTLVIPPSTISKSDVSRLLTEVELLDNDLTAKDIRAQVDGPVAPEPIISELLRDFLIANQLQIGDSRQRSQLIVDLRKLKDSVPTVHVTFATTADQQSLRQLIAWLRESVHPQAVMVIGLQPALIGGAYIRTTNQVYDLSVRAQLANHRDILVKDLEALSGTR